MAHFKKDQTETENNLIRGQAKDMQKKSGYNISEISVLRKLGQTIKDVYDFDKLCKNLLDIIIQSTITQNCSIMFRDRKKENLYLVCASEYNKQPYIIDPKKIFTKGGVIYIPTVDNLAAEKALKDNKVVLIKNATGLNFFSNSPETQSEIKSLLSIPIKIENRINGVINFGHSEPDIFKNTDVDLFRIIADFVGSALYSSLNYNRLQSREKNFRSLVEYSNNGIAIIQNDSHIYANPRYQELTGYTLTELQTFHVEKIIDFSYQLTNLRSLFDGLKDHSCNELFSARMIKKTGTILDVEITAYSMLYYDKRTLVISVLDISDRKILEKQLIHAQKMQSIGTLAAGIAHNFNNLLMGIQGNTSIALLDMKDDHPIYKNLNNIEKLIKNGSNLTNQLLGYARESKFEIKPINLNLILKETSETFGATRKDIKIILNLTGSLSGVKADQGQIEQTLLNLYVNAADAMPDGGTIFITTSNITDKEIADKPYRAKKGNYALITVRDSGVGIDPRIIDRVFEPFFTTKGLEKGTGLGLASAYGIIKGHGGYIDVTSTKGKGTTVSIYLPSTEELIIKEGKIGDNLYMGTGTILLVDDEKIIIYTGEQMLRKLGYNVIVAETGKEALDIFRKDFNNIDMVLLDMVMPGMGGGETYTKLKEINGSAKVLLSSGYNLDGQAKEIMEKGCDGFIQKPFTLKTLSQKVKEVLGD